MTDPISDMLTRIRNAFLVRHKEVVVPYSNLKKRLAEIMVREGYLTTVQDQADEGFRNLHIALKYVEGKPALRTIRRISKPGQRIYVKASRVPIVQDGLGIAILSTPKGLMTSRQARTQRMGGEILCELF